MRAGIAATIVIGLFLTAAPAGAQMTTDDVLDPGPRDEEVRSATAWDRIQDDVTYIRPQAEFRPDEGISVAIPPQPENRDAARDANRLTTGIVVFAIVALVLLIFVMFGNRINVSFGKTAEAQRKRAQEAEASPLAAALGGKLPENGLLEHLAAMADRRQALILLTGHALERAAKLNGLTLARAQTARDVLRILPRQWSHMGAMRKLVREAEVVHFGGRDLAEETFQACLDAARPLFAGAGARA